MHQQASSIHQPTNRMPPHESRNTEFSDSSMASSGSINDQSGENDSVGDCHTGRSSDNSRGWSRSRRSAGDTLAAFEGSTVLDAPTHTYDNPLTFSVLQGGDDDTPTAQFVPDRPVVSLAPQPAPPPPAQLGKGRQKAASRPSDLDPQDHAFWMSGDPGAQPVHAWQAVAQLPHAMHAGHQQGTGGLPAIHEQPGVQAFPYPEGAGMIPMGMPGTMPGVLGDVEDSGALAIRPENGEARQETWRRRSSNHSVPVNVGNDVHAQAAKDSAQKSAHHQPQAYCSAQLSSGDDSAQCAPRMASACNCTLTAAVQPTKL